MLSHRYTITWPGTQREDKSNTSFIIDGSEHVLLQLCHASNMTLTTMQVLYINNRCVKDFVLHQGLILLLVSPSNQPVNFQEDQQAL